MRQGTGTAAEASADVENRIQHSRGQGQPLGESVRAPMEQVFGADFSRVRIHTDGESHELNQAVQAKAFTTGQDIYFRGGAYEPGSRGGQELLAHELTHVVQQNNSLNAQRIQRDNKDKNKGTVYLKFQVKVPEDYKTLEQMYRLLERIAYGRETNSSWSCGDYCDMSQNRGKVIPFQVPKSQVETQSDLEQREQKKKHVEDYKKRIWSQQKGRLIENSDFLSLNF